MSVEKIPNMAAHGASNAKNAGGIKGGPGAEGAGDAKGGFGALLSSLGVDDVAPTVVTSAVPATLDDQSKESESSDGNVSVAFTPIIQATLLPFAAPDVDDRAIIGAQSTLLSLGDAQGADAFRLKAENALSSSVSPGAKRGYRAPGQADLSLLPDSGGGLGYVGIKAARLPKERGSTEIAFAVTPVPTQNAAAADVGKLDMRVIHEKTEYSGRALAPAAIDVMQFESSQQTEFRRDKTIFRTNSTTSGSDAILTIGLEVKPASLSLEGTAPDVGAGMTQGDQNPGTYWMSSDMKNAEMKLNGLGESPVEVSISVHGNQAHVAFRTDEALTRLALEDAGSTLKDMLSKEGLNLAGVSVGTSGADGDGAQEHRSRQEGRPALIGNLTSKFPLGTSGHVVTSRVGQLDVFV